MRFWRRKDPQDPRLRELKPKLDPRLYAILSLGQDRVRELRKRELETLRSIAAELTKLHAAVKDTTEFRQRGAEIWKRVGAPFTAGVHFKGEQRGLPERLKQSGEPILSVFVHSEISSSELAEHGFIIRSRVATIATAWVCWSSLEAAGWRDCVSHVELARAQKPSSPYPLAEAGLEAMHSGTPPHKGAGVIVGIADRFLDIHHPAFQSPGSAGTRILRLWDQEKHKLDTENCPADLSQSNPETADLHYGVEYSDTEIKATIANGKNAHVYYDPVRHAPPANGTGNNASPASSLVDSHGTLVAGAAVGNDLAGPSPMGQTPIGAAPEASLIFVHLCADDLTEWAKDARHPIPSIALSETTFIADAALFVFARAGELKMPCVFSVSQNDALGAHDGTSALEKSLSERTTGPGRVLVTSAGNEEGEARHFSSTSSTAALTFYVPSNDFLPKELQIWSKQTVSYSARLDLPGSGWLLGWPWPAWLAPGGEQSWTTSAGSVVRLISAAPDPSNGDNCITLLLLPGPQDATAPSIPNASGNYTIHLKTAAINPGFHAWLGHLDTACSLTDSTGGVTVAPPATAVRAVAVGAWNSPGGDGTAATLTAYSGRGPARDKDGQPGADWLPDLCAPTDFLSARAYNRQVLDAYPGTHPGVFLPNLPYDSISGTSASAPLVSGAAALLLECSYGTFTWQDVKSCLRLKAGLDPGQAAGNDWGYGRLDASALCDCSSGVQPPVTALWAKVPGKLPYPDVVVDLPFASTGSTEVQVVLQFAGEEAGFDVVLSPELAGVKIDLPLAVLPYRYENQLAAIGFERPLHGQAGSAERLMLVEHELGARETYERLDVEGASSSRILRGRVVLEAAGRVRVPRLRLQRGSELGLVLRPVLKSTATTGLLLCIRQFVGGAWHRLVWVRAGGRS